MKNEKDMYFLHTISVVMYVVNDVICDWNAWFQESCLIQNNERNQLCVIYLIFKIDFFNLKYNILIVFLYFIWLIKHAFTKVW